MSNKKNRRFKDNIKRTFIIYALIPVFIITFLSYIISFSIWYRTVIDRNRQINNEVSGRLDTILSSYMEKAYELSTKDSIAQCILLRQESTVIYEEYYKFTNSMDARCNFFVFDNKLEPIISSSKYNKKNAYDKVYVTEMSYRSVFCKETLRIFPPLIY